MSRVCRQPLMESSGESPSIEALVDLPEASDLQTPKRRSGMKLARISSSKYRKAPTKKLVVAADQKTKLRKLRSIRLPRQSSRNGHRSMTHPGIKKVSPLLNVFTIKDLIYCHGNQIRIAQGLWDIGEIETKRLFHVQDSSVNRPTCSSAIQGLRFLSQLEDSNEPGCDLSEKASLVEVCPYSYCSLHGHRHAATATSPSQKHVKSSRKHATTRNNKSEIRLPIAEGLNKETGPNFTEGNDDRKDDQLEPSGGVNIPDSHTGVAFRSTIGGRKYTVLWMMIYENMVSDIASEGAARAGALQEVEFLASDDMESESRTNASTPEEQTGICQGDVVKLLQGALDKLLLAQKSNQSLDSQSIADDSNLGGVSSHTEIKYEAGSGANTPRQFQNNEASSNRWGRLRKLILMRRFVKALEKTKGFYPRGQKSEVGHEVEVVNLRRPLIGERKRSEEWMLDYALREVVSKLDLEQQRRVSLLIEAFEKLSPMQGSNPLDGLNSSPGWQSNIARQEALDCSPRDGSLASLEQNIELLESEQKNQEARTADLQSCVLASKDDSEWSQEDPTASDSASASNPETRNSVEAADEGQSDREDSRTQNSTGELQSPDNNPDVDVSFGTELALGKNNGLWSLIYAHMVSDIEENSEGRLPIRQTAAGKTEDGNQGGDLNDGVVFKEEPESGHDTAASTPDGQMEICQGDAVKLLQEAISKLLHRQETDRSFDSPSEADDGIMNGRTENGINEDDARASDKPISSNRWGRLKKLILLKRFTRALEKTKKLDPKLQRYHQKWESYTDAETVSLRNQSIEERKRSEEWMLDYALRQAVSKLNQEQKRRVSLLVEAFEKVSPSQGCIPAIHPSSVTTSNRGQPQATVKEQITHTGSGVEGESPLDSNDDGKLRKEQGTDPCPDSMVMSEVSDESLEPHSENKRFTRLWYLVYQHMASGLAAEEGQGDDGNDVPRPSQVSPDQNAEGNELEKIEAVRLVQEAIDGILLSEGNDGSIDNQSPNSPVNRLENSENLQEIDIAAVKEKEGTESKVDHKFGGGAAKNWNNLKKLILIKRFLKSLSKVSKPDDLQRKPRRGFLRPEENRNEEEEERVSLRRRDPDERKSAEEWMLDYAMSRVVSELTPDRKRKVKLLVEAFESVAPPVVGI